MVWIPYTQEDLAAHAAWLRFTGNAISTITPVFTRDLHEAIRKYESYRSIKDYNAICKMVDQACRAK